jgi:hypothetical protein
MNGEQKSHIGKLFVGKVHNIVLMVKVVVGKTANMEQERS